MKKHITPYLLVFLLILVLAGGTFYMTKKYNLVKNSGDAASLYNAGPLIAPGYYFLDLNTGNGKCVRGTYNDDGTPIAVFQGSWAAATGECRLAITAPNTNNNLNSMSIRVTSTGGSTTINATSGEDYFKNGVSMQFLQLKLVKAGVLSSEKLTGAFNIETFTAIKSFQSKNNLPATGYIDSATMKLLNDISFVKSVKKPATPLSR